jgi:hypothetical protein
MSRLLTCPVLCALLLSPVATAGGRIINHRDVDGAAKTPQATMDLVGGQRWLFNHASIGNNCVMYKGMTLLNRNNPTRYQLVGVQVEPAFGDIIDPPPNPTEPGTIYHWPRGGWAPDKFRKFDEAVRLRGWHAPAVDMVMDKLCFIDYAAKFDTYLATITALERDYPDTTFIYVTIPLMRIDNPEHPEWRDLNVTTNQYNAAVRAHCAAHGRFLYDIADMEAHDPNGLEYTYEQNGQWYQTLYPGYGANKTNYLNDLGSQRVALGWYALTAAIANDPTGDLNCDAEVNFGDITPFVLALSDKAGYEQQYANCHYGFADCNHDGQLDFGDITPFVELLSE